MGGWRSGLTRALSSLKLTVGLLILIAALLVAGSLLPQGMEKDFYLQTWDEPTYDAVARWGLLDLFHRPLFLIPVALLAINLATCTWRVISRSVRAGTVADAAAAAVFHAAVLIMVGCFVATSLFSYQGELTLAPGETAWVPMKGGETKWAAFARRVGLPAPVSRPAPFAIRLRDFRTEYVEKGERLYVKDWISDLEIWEGGKAIRRKQVQVNDPLSYGGHKFYQASFDQVLTFDVSGETETISLGEPLQVGDTAFSVSPVKAGRVLGKNGRWRTLVPYVELKAAPAMMGMPAAKNVSLPVKLERGVPRHVAGKEVRFLSYQEKSGISYKKDAAVLPLAIAGAIFMAALAYRVYVQGFVIGRRKEKR